MLLIVLLGAVALILGVLLLVFAMWAGSTLSYALRKDGWRTTRGVVKDSRLVSNRKVNGLPGHHYFVAYEFEIDKEEYRSRRVRFGEFRYYTRGRAERVLARYPQGSTVRVYYDAAFQPVDVNDEPMEPLSVLEPGFNAECWYPIGLFLVVAAMTAATVNALIGAIRA